MHKPRKVYFIDLLSLALFLVGSIILTAGLIGLNSHYIENSEIFFYSFFSFVFGALIIIKALSFEIKRANMDLQNAKKLAVLNGFIVLAGALLLIYSQLYRDVPDFLRLLGLFLFVGGWVAFLWLLPMDTTSLDSFNIIKVPWILSGILLLLFSVFYLIPKSEDEFSILGYILFYLSWVLLGIGRSICPDEPENFY